MRQGVGLSFVDLETLSLARLRPSSQNTRSHSRSSTALRSAWAECSATLNQCENRWLNGLCAIALCVGLYFIKHRNKEAHRTSMLLAFAFSSVFLVSDIVNHALHGDTIFPGRGPVRTLYLSILASHVILSIIALPMVLTTLFFSVTDRFAMHRRIARWTFPVWLYVSITGVLVFVFLKMYADQTGY